MAEFTDKEPIRRVDIRTGAAPAMRSLGDRLAAYQDRRGDAAYSQVMQGLKQRNEAIAQNQRASMKSYLASVDRDVREGLAKIAAENPNDVVAFNEQANAFTEATLGAIDPKARELIEDKALGLLSNYRTKVQANNIALTRENNKKELLGHYDVAMADAQRLARNGDESSMLEAQQAMLDANKSLNAMVDDGLMTQADADAMLRKSSKQAAEQTFMSQIDAAVDISFQNGYDKIDELSEKIPKGWSPDEWNAFIAKAQTDLNREAGRQAKLDEAQLKAQEEALLLQRGDFLMNGNALIDPYGTSDGAKDDLKALNFAYDHYSKQWKNLPLDQQINRNVEFVVRTGVFPKTLESNVNAIARSGSVEDAVVSAEFISQITEQSPQSLRDLPDETRAISMAVNDAYKAGADVEQALEAARRNAYGLTEAEKKTIKIKTQTVAKELPGMLQSQLDQAFEPEGFRGVFRDAPNATPELQAEYRVAFDKHMVLTNGNVDQANRLAFQDLQKTWAVTRVGGKDEYMKYAPEAVYHIPGIPNSWISEQFDADMLEAGVEGGFIIATPEVARQKYPKYPVMTTDSKGMDVPLRDENGDLMTWRPDFTITDDYIETRAEPSKRLETGRKMRKKKVDSRFRNRARLLNTKFKNPLNLQTNLKTNPEHIDNVISNAVSAGDIEQAEADQLREFFNWQGANTSGDFSADLQEWMQ